MLGAQLFATGFLFAFVFAGLTSVMPRKSLLSRTCVCGLLLSMAVSVVAILMIIWGE